MNESAHLLGISWFDDAIQFLVNNGIIPKSWIADFPWATGELTIPSKPFTPSSKLGTVFLSVYAVTVLAWFIVAGSKKTKVKKEEVVQRVSVLYKKDTSQKREEIQLDEERSIAGEAKNMELKNRINSIIRENLARANAALPLSCPPGSSNTSRLASGCNSYYGSEIRSYAKNGVIVHIDSKKHGAIVPKNNVSTKRSLVNLKPERGALNFERSPKKWEAQNSFKVPKVQHEDLAGNASNAHHCGNSSTKRGLKVPVIMMNKRSERAAKITTDPEEVLIDLYKEFMSEIQKRNNAESKKTTINISRRVPSVLLRRHPKNSAASRQRADQMRWSIDLESCPKPKPDRKTHVPETRSESNNFHGAF